MKKTILYILSATGVLLAGWSSAIVTVHTPRAAVARRPAVVTPAATAACEAGQTIYKDEQQYICTNGAWIVRPAVRPPARAIRLRSQPGVGATPARRAGVRRGHR